MIRLPPDTCRTAAAWLPVPGPTRAGDYSASWLPPSPLPLGWVPAGALAEARASYGTYSKRIAFLPAASFAATVPAPNNDAAVAAVSVFLDPADPPLDLWVESAPCTVTFTREHLRLGGGAAAAVALRVYLVPHAADPRALLAWGVSGAAPAVAAALLPTPAAAAAAWAGDGMGAYTWWYDALNATAAAFVESVGVGPVWDLSGRWEPWQGMFLPPPADDGEEWENDADGTQPHRNVSCALLQKVWGWERAVGAAPLAYLNLYHFGKNFRRVPPAPAPWPAGLWRNATAFVSTALASALLLRTAGYFYFDAGCPPPPGWCEREGPILDWQGSAVLDPGDATLGAYVAAQVRRHSVCAGAGGVGGFVLDENFRGALYNLDADDGISFVGGAPAASLRVGWLAALRRLREAAPAAAVVLRNANMGTLRLDTNADIDGFFSEPAPADGVGVLAAFMPATLWTLDASYCCSSPALAAAFFGGHLVRGVHPMAPFPGNDHAVDFANSTVRAMYAEYGPLFRAQRGATEWLVSPPHFASVSDGSAFVNCFVPGGTAARGPAGASANATCALASSSSPPPGGGATATLTLRPARRVAAAFAMEPAERAGWVAVRAAPCGAGLTVCVAAPIGRGVVLVRVVFE